MILGFWDSVLQWLSAAGATTGIALLVVTMVTAAVAGWVLTVAGLPGNWLIPVVAILYDYAMPGDGRLLLGRNVILILFGLAIVGEVIEGIAGTLGVARKGGSRRGAIGSLIGSIVGGIAGAAIGLPIPVVGSVIGVILMAGVGAMLGTILAEKSLGKRLGESVDIGLAAMIGRIFGSLAKTLVGGVMVAAVLVAICV